MFFFVALDEFYLKICRFSSGNVCLGSYELLNNVHFIKDKKSAEKNQLLFFSSYPESIVTYS
jgi:hypothetical protein